MIDHVRKQARLEGSCPVAVARGLLLPVAAENPDHLAGADQIGLALVADDDDLIDLSPLHQLALMPRRALKGYREYGSGDLAGLGPGTARGMMRPRAPMRTDDAFKSGEEIVDGNLGSQSCSVQRRTFHRQRAATRLSASTVHSGVQQADSETCP